MLQPFCLSVKTVALISLGFCVILQNPVVSVVWMFGNLQLLAPAAGMASDTRAFCQPLLRFKPALVVFVVITSLAYVDILVKNHVFNPLNLYNFPWSFRLQFGGQCLGGIIFYSVLVISFRQLMDVYTHQRVTSFWDFIT